MADLLTVYDDGDSNTFIDCTICDKRIRGDTNFKIHLTTLQHLKRERALADKGLIAKPAPLPQWDGIKDYLTYLNLNEPIIGLGDLVQEQDFVSNDGVAVLRYRCRLCSVQMDLYDMATHVVGRRHRQKYLERHRPDLVTWEKNSEKQAGVVARAKAAIVEKQEGWGNPVPLIRSDKGRSLKNRGGAAQNRPSLLQGRAFSGRDRRPQGLYNQSYMEGDAYGKSSLDKDNRYDRSYGGDVHHQSSGSGSNRYDQSYRDDVPQRSSGVGDNRYSQAYRDDVPHRSSGSGNNQYNQSYIDDIPHHSSNSGDNRYDQSYRDEVPQRSSGVGDNRYAQAYRDDVPHRSSGSGDNGYDQSYRDDVPHRSSGSGDNQYDPPYSQDSRQRRSYQETDYVERPYLEDEVNEGAFPGDGTNQRDYMEKSDSQPYHDERYSETNPSRGPYKSREGDDYYRDNGSENRFGESGRDYQESGRMQDPMYTLHHGKGFNLDERQRQNRNLLYTETGRERFEDVDETGRRGSFEMQGYNKRESYYPPEDDIPSKKKRKSRFSDASPLEMALAQKSQIDDMLSKYKLKGRAGPTKNPVSGNNMDSGVTPRMENVLDVLNDIQIENVQEANFLKDKLCTLLKEFQSNKVQRTQGQVSQTSADFTDGYYGGNKMERRRDVLDSRRLDDQGFQEPSRYDRDLQGPREYFHTRNMEDDLQNLRQNRGPEEPEYQWDPYREGSAGRSEERVACHPDDRRGFREGAWNTRPQREEERLYAEEHRYQHDYRSGGDPYDPFEPSSSPPLEAASSTLDKLASTLLELVARKTN